MSHLCCTLAVFQDLIPSFGSIFSEARPLHVLGDTRLLFITSCPHSGLNTNLTTGRGSQDVIGVHGAQLVPAAIPSRLALDADDLVNSFQAVHTHRVQVHQSPWREKAPGSERPSPHRTSSPQASSTNGKQVPYHLCK